MLQVLLVAAITVAVAVQSTRVGWGEIIGALPNDPLFYVLLVVVYLLLPIKGGQSAGRSCTCASGRPS